MTATNCPCPSALLQAQVLTEQLSVYDVVAISGPTICGVGCIIASLEVQWERAGLTATPVPLDMTTSCLSQQPHRACSTWCSWCGSRCCSGYGSFSRFCCSSTPLLLGLATILLKMGAQHPRLAAVEPIGAESVDLLNNANSATGSSTTW